MIPRIFQIIYDSQAHVIPHLVTSMSVHTPVDCSAHVRQQAHSPLFPLQEPERHNGAYIEHKGHHFVIVTYRMRTECEVCNQPCYHLISPPPCLQCTRCRVRCHKQHYDDKEFIQPCRGRLPEEPNGAQSSASLLVFDASTAKELLVMCSSENEQKRWIATLSPKVPRPVIDPLR